MIAKIRSVTMYITASQNQPLKILHNVNYTKKTHTFINNGFPFTNLLCKSVNKAK